MLFEPQIDALLQVCMLRTSVNLQAWPLPLTSLLIRSLKVHPGAGIIEDWDEEERYGSLLAGGQEETRDVVLT